MLRCKEGDLAVMLMGPYTGYFVTVGEFLGDIRAISADHVPFDAKNVWRVHGDGLISKLTGRPFGMEDAYLQPIRPGRTPVTTETKKEITA